MPLKIDSIMSEHVLIGGSCGCCGREFHGPLGAWVDSNRWSNDPDPDTFTIEDLKEYRERMAEQLVLADRLLAQAEYRERMAEQLALAELSKEDPGTHQR